MPAARARGEEAVLTWGPPVKVNFELATPNSVHGCTLARPTWRRMKKEAGVHGARAVHVQVVCTLGISHAPSGQMGGTTDLKHAGNFGTIMDYGANLVQLWKSMSVIRWYMSFRDRVHSARAMHVHYAYA